MDLSLHMIWILLLLQFQVSSVLSANQTASPNVTVIPETSTAPSTIVTTNNITIGTPDPTPTLLVANTTASVTTATTVPVNVNTTAATTPPQSSTPIATTAQSTITSQPATSATQTTTKQSTTEEITTTKVPPITPTDNSNIILAVVLSIFGIILIIFIIVLYYYCNNRYPPCCPGKRDEENIPLDNAASKHGNRRSMYGRKFLIGHTAISRNEFENVFKSKSADDNRNFRAEFNEVAPGVSPKTEAQKPENAGKNRYDNVLPYDCSRVVITPGSNPVSTDYINASYVSGYGQVRKWIACQGPKNETINDFWRMMWEQNSLTIIMVTRLVENGKPKCNQYWPGEDNEAVPISQEFGEYRVTLEDVKHRNFFVIRSFKLEYEGESRIVKQFHYTAWPDFGVPSNAAHLLKFRRRIIASNPPNAGPIVIHCSAGVGRTGTYILIDASIEQLMVEEKIDLFTFLNKIREERMMLVQTDAQYAFAHKAVLEQIKYDVTEVSISKFKKQVYELRDEHDGGTETALEEQFQKLVKIPIQKDHLKHGRRSLKKNRVLQIIPYDHNRVTLPKKPGNEKSDYINASYIDGFERSQSFIATQGPMQETAEDFWAMIWHCRLSTIVMLTRLEEKGLNTCYKYWPSTDEATVEHGDVTITIVSEDDDDVVDYMLREFTLTNSQDPNETRTVRQFHYQAWPDIGSGSPSDAQGLLEIINRVGQTNKGEIHTATVVHCSSGGGRTGVYCCLSILIDELEQDGMIDVFQTARHLREQRPHIIQNQEQLYFCYLSVLQYLEANQISECGTMVSNLASLGNTDASNGPQLLPPPSNHPTASLNNHVDFSSNDQSSSSLLPEDSKDPPPQDIPDPPEDLPNPPSDDEEQESQNSSAVDEQEFDDVKLT